MSKPSGDEIALHYLAAYDRLVEFVPSLTEEQLATPVPALPGWTVHDVLAHLAANPTDIMAGRLTSVPTDDHTQGQVEDRRDYTAGELIHEWSVNAQAMGDGARAGLIPANLAVDALTHEQDIRGVLGLPPALTPTELRFCTNAYCYACSAGFHAINVPALSLIAVDSDFKRTIGGGNPATTVRAAEFEFFRTLAGRRGRKQVLGYEWDGDPEPYLDHLNIFGTLPEDDLPD